MDYLALPVLMKDGYLQRCELKESILHSVGLILSSRIGLVKFLPEYGCEVWEKEFSDIYTTNKADIRARLRNSIGKYENRLMNISVAFEYVIDGSPHVLGMAVRVSGNYKDGNEEKKLEGTFFLG
jgi:phage baseplate assembly protein W